jgi:L-fuculokinase
VPTATLVLDIGKTNVKLVVVSKSGDILDVQKTANAPLDKPPYLQLDTELVWEWLLHTSILADQHRIDAISITTHGCAAVLIDAAGPVLPPMDYEADPPADIGAEFAAVTPPFDVPPHCLSASISDVRLFWQQRGFPEEFSRARSILNYPQYWAWRLSGVEASEVTSVGCHSHLWEPANRQFSTLIETMGWRHLFPPFKSVFDPLGPITTVVAGRTGLAADCQVYTGIHDSNSAYSLYMRGHDSPFSRRFPRSRKLLRESCYGRDGGRRGHVSQVERRRLRVAAATDRRGAVRPPRSRRIR